MDIPPFPYFIFDIVQQALDALFTGMEDDEMDMIPPPFPMHFFQIVYDVLMQLEEENAPLDRIMRELFPHGHNVYQEVWPLLANNPTKFWYLTSETPNSLSRLVAQLHVPTGRLHTLTFRDEILLTFIWLRQYPTLISLSQLFATSTRNCWFIIRYNIFKIAALVTREISWPDINEWHSFRGTYPDFPNCVAIMDCTPIRISVPTGKSFIWPSIISNEDVMCKT